MENQTYDELPQNEEELKKTLSYSNFEVSFGKILKDKKFDPTYVNDDIINDTYLPQSEEELTRMLDSGLVN